MTFVQVGFDQVRMDSPVRIACSFMHKMNKFRGRDISAPPFRRWTTRRRAVSALDISAPFPIFFYFSSYEEDAKKQAIS